MKINVVTIFPEFFAAPLGLSIPKRAADARLVDYRIIDLRDHPTTVIARSTTIRTAAGQGWS